VSAQPPEIAPSRPLRKPSRKELDRLEALKVFALAVQLERKNLLPEALKTYEKSLRLDPESTGIRRALVPLYLAFDRPDEALDACRKVLDREPGDFESWYLLARQLRGLDREADAREALENALGCKGVSERPELHLEIAPSR
jgi:predicted Zn-dependent protease